MTFFFIILLLGLTWCPGNESWAFSPIKKRPLSLLAPIQSSLYSALSRDNYLIQAIQQQVPLVLNPVLNGTALFSAASDLTQVNSTLWKKEISGLRARVDKLERSVASLSAAKGKSSSTPVDNFVDAITAGTIQMNAKTVERCAMVSYFFVGALIGASLLDRLWLLGGIAGAWWAAGIVKRNTRAGKFARRVGVKVARVVIDLQEKYNQAIIFYRTGKLAYYSSKVWETYDQKFAITHKMNEWKKLAMDRAMGFNSTTFDKLGLTTQLQDLYKVMLSAPDNAKEIDKKYQLTSSLVRIGKESVQNMKVFFDIEDSDDNPSYFLTKSSSSMKKRTNSQPSFLFWKLPEPSSSVKRKSRGSSSETKFTIRVASNSLYTIVQKSLNKAVDVLLDKDMKKKKSNANSWIWFPGAKPKVEEEVVVAPLAQKAIAVLFLLTLLEIVKLSLRIVTRTLLRIVR